MGWVVGAMVVLGGGVLQGQTGQVVQVGTIDFFGGQGMDTAALLAKLPLKVGQPIKEEQFEALKGSVRAAVLAATGKPDTDLAVVCCDQPGKLQVYVGVEGSSYRAPKYAAPPVGAAALPEDGVGLYRAASKANAAAVESGRGGEDDSNGYALTDDAAAKAIQLRMREYALHHGAGIEEVLRESKDAEQRQAAAALLGYAERSQEQVKALARAATDTDSEVRNNAVRALGVLAVAQPLVGLDVEPFVQMLYSGQWSDRNKASLLLRRITESRDPVVLAKLRDEAMGPLLDGAQWQSAGHAFFFLILLGRIGGLDEGRIQTLMEAGDRAAIVAAAQRH